MKRFLFIILLLITVIGLASCDNPSSDTPHEHTAVVLSAIPATCTETGLSEGKKCSSCNEIIVAQETIEKLPHTEETIPAVTASCTTDGLTEGKKCSVCNEILVAQEVIKASHAWNAGTVTTEPTCTEKGVKTFECDNCDATKTEDVNANGHNYSSVVTNKTCAANGKITFTCPTCDNTYEEIIAPISISIAHVGTSSATMNGYGRFSLSYKISTSGGYGTVLCKMELFKTSSANSVSQMDYTDFSDSNYEVSYTGYEDTINEYYLVITTKDDANNITICKVDLGSITITDQYVKDDHHYSDVDDKCTICGKLIDYTEGLRYGLINNGTEYAVTSIGSATDSDIIIPRTYNGKPVTAIGESAFEDCETIHNVRLHSGIKTIGMRAFQSSSLSSINLPNGLQRIEHAAFLCCDLTNVPNISIPDSVIFLDAFAFAGCYKLTTFEFSDNIDIIYNYCLSQCITLTTITIPKTVSMIESRSFEECTALEHIIFEGTRAEWAGIQKETAWDVGTGNYIVHCIDGDLTKAEA